MKFQTCQGTVSFYKNGFIINGQVKNLNNVFKEIFKLIPKETKIKDIKKSITNKVSILLQ